ncbi:hypothetical protein FRC19_003591 [Serendipita sp. 401]|nr:hypothetical protein FRC19_003591 [Serendipita sp. 401]
MRQMEEQFTSYDFRKMARRSYYPTNQQIMTTMTATSSMGLTPSRPETPADNISINAPRKTDDFTPMQAVPMGRVGRGDSHNHPIGVVNAAHDGEPGY